MSTDKKTAEQKLREKAESLRLEAEEKKVDTEIEKEEISPELPKTEEKKADLPVDGDIDVTHKETAMTAKEEAENLSKIVDAFLIGTATAKKFSPEQITLCKQTAISFGLNPLKREIHFIPREIWEGPKGNKHPTGKFEVSIVIGYEVYLKRAERTNKLNGWKVSFVKEGTDTKGILTVHKKGWDHPFEHEVYLSEARQNTSIWDKMPKFMLRKVLIGQGFRLCFPDEMGGLPYMPEELGIGVIQDGQLIEDQKLPAPAPAQPVKHIAPPRPSNPQQNTMILGLLVQKGKDQKVLLDYFKVEKLSMITYAQAEATIKKLQDLPDKPDDWDQTATTPSGAEEVDPDEIAAAIDAQKLEEGSKV